MSCREKAKLHRATRSHLDEALPPWFEPDMTSRCYVFYKLKIYLEGPTSDAEEYQERREVVCFHQHSSMGVADIQQEKLECTKQD